MLTAYVIACILVAVGAVLFGIGWKKGQKSEAYDAYTWLFLGAVCGIIGGLVALIQWMYT